jgi:protein TonB
MVGFRLVAFGLSAIICSTLAYLAMTHKISGIEDLFDMSKSIQVQTERKPPPPPPPPPPPNTPPPPPPPMAPPVMDAPATAVDIPVTPPAPPPPPAAQVIASPTWVKKPNGRDFERFFPPRALEREKSGRVVLACTVAANGTIDCTVSSETPEGWGFADAALKMSKLFQMSPQTVNGQPTAGGRVNVPISFQLGQ